LLEGLVFGARAGEAMAADHNPAPAAADERRVGGAAPTSPPAELRAQIQARCWQALGLERDARGLAALARWLEETGVPHDAVPAERAAAETRNLAEVALAMARSAAFREESRGAHFRTDFPRLDDVRFRGHTLLDGGGARLVDVESPVGATTSC